MRAPARSSLQPLLLAVLVWSACGTSPPAPEPAPVGPETEAAPDDEPAPEERSVSLGPRLPGYSRANREGLLDTLCPLSGTGLLGDEVRIAHGGGALDNLRGSNSREAIEAHYAAGVRLFEIDLTFDADGTLVCLHDQWEPFVGFDRPVSRLSTSEFREGRFAGRLPLLTFEELLALLGELPEALLVIDLKDDYRRSLERIAATIMARNPCLLRRLVVQFYQPEELAIVEEVLGSRRAVRALIFSTYKNDLRPSDVAAFAREHALEVVAVPTYKFFDWFAADLRKHGAELLVYTVNDEAQAQAFFEQGATGIYTDFLLTPGATMPEDVYPPF